MDRSVTTESCARWAIQDFGDFPDDHQNVLERAKRIFYPAHRNIPITRFPVSVAALTNEPIVVSHQAGEKCILGLDLVTPRKQRDPAGAFPGRDAMIAKQMPRVAVEIFDLAE